MKKIDTSKLKKGDIILTTSTEPMSKAIKFFTNSDISHAMICVSDGSVMDCTGEGVQARNIQKMFYDDSCSIYVYRLASDISSSDLNKVIAYVRSETGASYSLGEAIVSPVVPKLKGGKNQFCSRLVARAYASIGIDLTKNTEFATPADIQKSKVLIEISDVVLTVSIEEQALLEAYGDSTVGMRAVTNKLLTTARSIDSSIRTLNDIEPLLLRRPDLDSKFVTAYRDSGYLTYWKKEAENFPWRYDPVAIVQYYHATENKDELLEYCRQTIEQDANGVFAHWEANARALQELIAIKSLETFALSLELYRKLSFQHHVRVQAANILLRVYGS